MKLEHIGITISDNQEINAFYQNILAFELTKTFELNAVLSEKIFGMSKIVSVYVMQRNDITLEIFVHPEVSAQKYNHICLSTKDRESIYKKAIVHHYLCVRIKRDQWDMVFIKDKIGNLFEIKPF